MAERALWLQVGTSGCCLSRAATQAGPSSGPGKYEGSSRRCRRSATGRASLPSAPSSVSRGTISTTLRSRTALHAHPEAGVSHGRRERL